MKVLDENRPRLGVFAGINVQDETDNVRLHFVQVHCQLTVIAIQAKAVRAIRY
jgi:hypothetical protein